VVDGAGGGEDDVVRLVERAVIRRHVAAAEPLDHLGAADDGPAEGLIREHALADEVEDQVVGCVVEHRDLFQHDLALLLEVVPARRRHHPADDVERLRQVLVDDPRVDRRRLAGRPRVQLGAEAIEDLRDLERRMTIRAPEQQVLDEVRDACDRGGLVTRAHPDPGAYCHRAHARHELRRDAQPRGQRRQLVPHEPAECTRRTGRSYSRGPRRRRRSPSSPRSGRSPRSRPWPAFGNCSL
jgi:hypothetical protein